MPNTNHKRILVTSALRYATGPVHVGHVAGAYLSADIFVRYQRSRGSEVIHIGGTDEYGVPVTVKAELPGMRPDDINVSVQGNTLSITGEKKEETEERKEGYYHSERRFGSFRRDLILPADVDSEKVDAAYKEGVLTITMPKTEAAKAKAVKVKS